MEMNCCSPLTFFKLSHQSADVISLQLEGSGVQLPLSENPPGMSSRDWLSEAAPGAALPGPACSSVLLLFVWAGHDLDYSAEPDKTQLLKKKEKLFSTLNHTNAGAGWEREAGM